MTRAFLTHWELHEVVTSVNRPSDVGSVVTATLDLQPGTNYDIDVVANFYSVQISENQSNQDSLGATTFLSPPFLGRWCRRRHHDCLTGITF